MTAVSVIKPSRRGTSSRKRPLWLPIIAPKDDATIPTAGPDTLSSGPVRTTIPKSRIRFPPRSRTGCWTCRSRKVKCDESHPQCNQCTRLGHECDYSPRLCFRDDTRRVMDRMKDVSTAGNVVWDPAVSRSHRNPYDDLTPHDLLPSFAVLTSDEEREKKAQASRPGTYHVVVVPESFSHLPEYIITPSEKDLKDSLLSPFSDDIGSEQFDSPLEMDDPNIVILKIFRDIRRYPYSNRRGSTQSPDSDLPVSFPADPLLYPTIEDIADEDPADDKFDLKNYEIALLEHFRTVVLGQLIAGAPICAPTDHRYELGMELFEQEAANFPPLFLAMMAVSALSQARQGGEQDMSSLHYVHQAYSALQSAIDSNHDSLSDGLFLTYFLLLIYEVDAPKANSLDLWPHHVSQFLQIYLARQSAFGGERYPLLIWWVCHLDLHSLLSGIGTGEFVRSVMDHHLYHGLDLFLCPRDPASSDLAYPTEDENLSIMLHLYRDTFMLFIRLGMFAMDMRNLKSTYPDSPMDNHYHGVEELREEFRRLWAPPEVCFLLENRSGLPERSQYVLQQVILLFHTALLFSYTSLWPRQRLEPRHAPEEEIHHHATTVLQLAETMIPSERESQRHLLNFPVFLAGAVAASSGLKIRAWQLLSNVEEEEIGYHASTSNYLLQLVYERQMQHTGTGGEAFWIDWVELIAEQESPALVHYG
ncbi:hypothetical protein FE257_011923 [Aspergillus nanangensis]|uniref:Zn(2)-C6 fungal-type domain-containing protein n=1 Tax=Aspergillus nanangensis TaxID=2582783 RepID=A0AAD4CGU2_ASPNN|nr:hypothetical protein FE257_011923 [Aspergillus nanangensis]